MIKNKLALQVSSSGDTDALFSILQLLINSWPMMAHGMNSGWG